MINQQKMAKAYLFQSIAVKEGPHRTSKHLYGDEASVVIDGKVVYINKSNWRIKGKDIEKMDGLESDKLVISTTKGKTYEFHQFVGNESSWQEFRKKLEKVYARKTDAPKDSFLKFIKGSSKLGLGSPQRVRAMPTKVVTDKRTPPRRTHGVFGRARQRPYIPSVPWDNEETTVLSDERPDDSHLHVTTPPSMKSPSLLLSEDELEDEPLQRVTTRKRRLVIDDDSADEEEEIGSGLPMTTPQANRVVSPRLSTRSASPKREREELDRNQTTLASFFKKEKNAGKPHLPPVKSELELTPKKPTVKLVSTPTRLGKSSTGSNKKRSLQQKGWLSPSNSASRGRTMERFGILSNRENKDELELEAKKQSNTRLYSSTFGSSSAMFVFNKDTNRDEIEEDEASPSTPKMPLGFLSQASPGRSPIRSRLAFKKVSSSPIRNHAVNDLSKSQPEPELRFNQFSGLRNLGNTCYMNACLQMICTLPNLIKALKNSVGPLAKSLVDVAGKLQQDPVRAVDPRAIKEAMDAKTTKFLGYEQRDAHEFISDLLDFIHEEGQVRPEEQESISGDAAPGRKVSAEQPTQASNVSSEPFGSPRQETSPMDSFLFTVHVCLTCSSCGYSRSKEETYRHLSVDIIGDKEGGVDTKATVEKGLEKFFEPEIRDIKCEKCKDGTQASQTMQMIQRPDSLLLHLKRFIFVEKPLVTTSSNDENKPPNSPSKPIPMEYVFQKNKDQVQLSECLSLDPFLLKDETSTESKKEYKLRSIVHHIGSRASSGHYTADAVRPAKGSLNSRTEGTKDGAEAGKDSSTADGDERYSWVTFDDTTSCVTSLDKILSNENKERTAYMLLYSLDEP